MTSQPATESVWSRLSDDLRRFIRRRVADDHAADDLLQETFLRIHRSVGTLADEDRLAAWVYQIARNVIHDYYRKQSADVSLAEADPADEQGGMVHLRARDGEWLDELPGSFPIRIEKPCSFPRLRDCRSLKLPSASAFRIPGRSLVFNVAGRCCEKSSISAAGSTSISEAT